MISILDQLEIGPLQADASCLAALYTHFDVSTIDYSYPIPPW